MTEQSGRCTQMSRTCHVHHAVLNALGATGKCVRARACVCGHDHTQALRLRCVDNVYAAVLPSTRVTFTDDKEVSLAMLRDVQFLKRIDWQQLATIWRMYQLAVSADDFWKQKL